MGLVQGYSAVQEIPGGWEITQVLMWEGEGLCVALTAPGAWRKRQSSGSAAVTAWRQWGRVGAIASFRPFAFFYPSTFCKHLMFGTVFFWMVFLWGGEMDVFCLQGTSLLPPSCRALPLPTRRAQLKINGSAWRFNYSSTGRGGE